MSEFNNFNFQNKPVTNIDLEKYKPIMKIALWIIGILIVFLLIFNAFTFTVNEREQVVVRQFNEIVKVIVSEENYDQIKEELTGNARFEGIVVKKGKGLFLKIPIIQNTASYTSMLLTYDTNPNEVVTQDKKKLVLDNFAEWKIVNPVLYLSTIGSDENANRRIDEILYSSLREKIGRENAIKVISDKEYVAEMLLDIKDEANTQLNQYGIKVIDVRIKRTELPPENFENLFNRMRTERNKEATRYRSEGKEEAQKIRSQAEKEAVVIEAEAYKTSEETKGEGDAAALKIYAEAFSADIEFYKFWRTLEAYKITMDRGTTIVIDSKSDFVQILTGNEE